MSSNQTTSNPGSAQGGLASPQTGLEMSPYSQIAPLTAQQQAGMQLTSDLSQPVQQYLGTAMGANQALGASGGGGLNPAMNAYFSSGGLMSPSSNPYLQQYAQDALQQQLQSYQQATAPNLLQQAASSGTLGSAGMAQGFNNAQAALSQGIGNTLAGIYEPAYNQGLNATQNALNTGLSTALSAQGMAPQLASAQYTPAQQLATSGATGQQQAQNVLNTATQNLTGQANWPLQALQSLGQGLNTASGGGSQGVTIGTSPSTAAGK